MKASFTVLFSFFFLLSFSQKGTTELSLNGEWKFKTDPNLRGESLKWFSAEMKDNEWDSMNVPGNWDLKNEYAHYAGKAWYRKNITIKADWKDKLVALTFEAVSGECKVWLNGKYLGSNNISYLSFQFIISSLLNFNSPNTLVVSVNNTSRQGAPWNWGGIRRPVTLVATNPVFISGIHISPYVDLKENQATISTKIKIENTSDQKVSVQGTVAIILPGGSPVSLPFMAGLQPHTVEDVYVTTTLKNENVHLWHFDDPYLYNCTVSLKNGNEVLHEKNERFGLRKIEVDNKNYSFKLNGEAIRPMGFNLVPDDRTTGNTLPLWRIKEDIDMMRAAGANMARLAHFPFPKEMLDYLDERGMMIIEEVPVWGYDTLVDKNNPAPKEWLNRLIADHYNHPAIIGWSVGNEIGNVPGVMEYVDNAIQLVRSLDSTRLATVVSHTADNGAKDIIQYSDIGLVNKYGQGIGMLADKMHNFHPEKLLFYSEYGYGQTEENLNSDIDAKGMVDSIRFKPYLIGGSIWTWNDYRSSYVGTREFSENRPWGVVNVFRQKKKAYYSLRKEYAPIRGLSATLKNENKNVSINIAITPRTTLDLPAYNLKNYVLAWKGYDDKAKILDGGFKQLPLIKPGDKTSEEQVVLKRNASLSYIQLELISPLNYTVYDTTIFLKKPEPPKIVYAKGVRIQFDNRPANRGAMHIVFAGDGSSTMYKARYGKNSLTDETSPTRNHFINIQNLQHDEVYKVAVVGINNAGESEPSNVQELKIESGMQPPTIYYTEPADKGFFVGYATTNVDYLYQLQYTNEQGNYSNAEMAQSSTKGVLFAPNLINGQRYYFRMKAIKHNNFHSDWSEEYSIVPDGNQLPQQPILEGVLVNNTTALISFKPVKKAIGYVIYHRTAGNGEWKKTHVSSAQTGNFLITGLNRKKVYEFKMSSKNEQGESEVTDIIHAKAI